MTDRFFLNIVPPSFSKMFVKFLYSQAQFIVNFFSSIKKDVEKFEQKVDPVEYIATGLVSYYLLAFVLALGVFRLFQSQEIDLVRATLLSILIFGLIVFILVFLAIKHPVSNAVNKAKDIDKYLLYALRDLSLQVSSGETVYNAMVSVSEGGYKSASREFSLIAKKINVGIPMEIVLREALRKTESEYMRKTYWQIINGIKSGSDLTRGLDSVISELNSEQKSKIQNYARELGLWSLVYMMFSVAIPTIGITMLVILSTFAGFGLNQATFLLFVVASMIVQVILIVFVKSRRPAVHF